MHETAPADERRHGSDGQRLWNESYYLDWFDPKGRAGGYVRLGLYPEPLYDILPYQVDYVPYTTGHVVTMLQLLLFSGLAFFVMLPYMKRTLTITLDFDWFYRKLFKLAAREAADRSAAAHAAAFKDAEKRLGQLIGRIFRAHGPHGILARTWPTGSMVLWAAALLALSLVLYY